MTSPTGPQWVPDREQVGRTRVVRFARWLGERGLVTLADPTDYRELQAWSAAHVGDFWQAVTDFFDVDFGTRATTALGDPAMPGAEWFPGATLNFGHHLLRRGADDRVAVVVLREDGHRDSVTYAELRARAASVAARLEALGVQPGDRVAAYLPNCVEGVVAFAACALLGATWSQTALDYAPQAAADRLAQLEPTVLFAGGGYVFKGQVRDQRSEVAALRRLLPTLRHTIAVQTAGLEIDPGDEVSTWAQAVSEPAEARPRQVSFDHPLWVLFTSGTTGRPKGIVHGHGGALLEQLVSPGFHLDLAEDDVFFWFTSPNWMMWNAEVCGLLHGATIILYDGNPTSPGPEALWRIAADEKVTAFGTSPGYLLASARAGLEPGRDLDLSRVRVIGVDRLGAAAERQRLGARAHRTGRPGRLDERRHRRRRHLRRQRADDAGVGRRDQCRRARCRAGVLGRRRSAGRAGRARRDGHHGAHAVDAGATSGATTTGRRTATPTSRPSPGSGARATRSRSPRAAPSSSTVGPTRRSTGTESDSAAPRSTRRPNPCPRWRTPSSSGSSSPTAATGCRCSSSRRRGSLPTRTSPRG